MKQFNTDQILFTLILAGVITGMIAWRMFSGF